MYKGNVRSAIIVALSLFTSLFTLGLNAQTNVIARWDFNSSPPDKSFLSGSLIPTVGFGAARPIGEVNYLFLPGSPDDESIDNTSWTLLDFPEQEAGNKTSGAEFQVSTLGFENITLEFQVQSGATSSRYARLQYTTNGTDYFDASRLEIPATNGFHRMQRQITLPAASNNPMFIFRFVSEFERTIRFGGTHAYVAAGESDYSPYGPLKFDLVKLTGTEIPSPNTPPVFSTIEDRVQTENQPGTPFTFSLTDTETAPDELIVIALSTNPSLVPHDQIEMSRSGTERQLSVTPLQDQVGATTIRITAIDQDGGVTSSEFIVTVMSETPVPIISDIPPQVVTTDPSTQRIPFTLITDQPLPDNLMFDVNSSDPSLFDSVMVEGDSTNHNVILSLNPGKQGTTVITLSVTDSRDTQTARFPITVVTNPETILHDTFRYRDGSVVTTSAGAWAAHSSGDQIVSSVKGKLRLSSSGNQDVHVNLMDAPYSGSTPVYSAFTVQFDELPSLAGSYFAHLNTSSFKSRIFAHKVNAAPGSFRLGIANGAGTRVEWPNDLELDTPYRIVSKFIPDQGISTLWINPATESDQQIAATLEPNPASITRFSLRQASGIGSLSLDDLKIGTTFNAVAPESAAMLSIQTEAEDQIKLSWPSLVRQYEVESAPSSDPTAWSEVTALPFLEEHHWVIRMPSSDPPRFFRLVAP